MIGFYIALFAATLLFYLFVNSSRRGKDEPPGPTNLPIIGGLLSFLTTGLADKPILAFDAIARKYGGIASLKMGIMDTIVISDYEAYKEIMPKEEIADRFLVTSFNQRQRGRPDVGIVFNIGESWKYIRRWTIRTLRDFGFGKRHTQEYLMNMEIQELMNHMEKAAKKNNGILHVDNLHSLSALNVLWSMVAGYRYNLDDEKLIHLLELTKAMVRTVNFASNSHVIFPILTKIAPSKSGGKEVAEATNNISKYLLERLEEHQKRDDFATNPQCFIDVFAAKMKEEAKDPNTPFTKDNYVTVLMDLFQAGSETSSTILDFSLLYMSTFPHVQAKIQEEIDRVVPKEEQMGYDHMKKLPYTNATILELFRHSNFVPIQINRLVTKEFYAMGYRFKKGKIILPITHGLFFEKKFWGDPEQFRPERFLDNNNEFIKEKVDRIVPFGMGKRVCMGQQLAEAVVFTFMTTTLRNYEISQVPGQPKTSLEPRNFKGAVYAAQVYDVVLKKRVK